MAERMLQFIHLPQHTPEKREVAERRADFDEIYSDSTPQAAKPAVQPLQPMRHAVLLDPLPAVQQHPGLAEAHRRGAAGGSL